MGESTAELEDKKIYEKAKVLLEDAQVILGDLKADLKADKAEIEKIIGDTLTCLNRIENADSKENTIPKIIKEALDTIRGAAELLAEEDTDDESTRKLAETVAKTMALLYPISKLEDGPSRVPASPYKESKAPSPFEDRRASPRIAIEADIGFQSETNFFMGFAEDISAGGLFICTFDVREIGSQIDVNFTLPNGHLVSAVGIVRWLREYNELIPDTQPGMGVQFENLDENDKEIINQFIEKRAPIFYDD